MKRMINAVVVNDNRFNDDVIHVSNLLEVDFLDEDRETSQNKHLNDHFFLNFSHVRFSF